MVTQKDSAIKASEQFEAAKTESKKNLAVTKDKLLTASDEEERDFKALEAEV